MTFAAFELVDFIASAWRFSSKLAKADPLLLLSSMTLLLLRRAFPASWQKPMELLYTTSRGLCRKCFQAISNLLPFAQRPDCFHTDNDGIKKKDI